MKILHVLLMAISGMTPLANADDIDESIIKALSKVSKSPIILNKDGPFQLKSGTNTYSVDYRSRSKQYRRACFVESNGYAYCMRRTDYFEIAR